MKSELNYKDRYEVADEYENKPLTKREKRLVFAFVVFIILAVPLCVAFINWATNGLKN